MDFEEAEKKYSDELIEKHFPPFSDARKEVRKSWKNVKIRWQVYLLYKAIEKEINENN